MALLIIGIIIFISYLSWRAKNSNRKWYDFGVYNRLTYVIIGCLVFIVLLNALSKPVSFSNPEHELKYGKKWGDKKKTFHAALLISVKDSGNAEKQFDALFELENLTDYGPASHSLDTLQDIFYRRLTTGNVKMMNLSNLGLAYLQYIISNDEKAKDILGEISDSTLPYFHFILAKLAWRENDIKKCEKNAWIELNNPYGFREGACKILSNLYQNAKAYPKIGLILEKVPEKSWVPFDIRQNYYMSTRSYFNIILMNLRLISERADIISVSGSLSILLLWVYFLVSIDFNSRKTDPAIPLTILGGAAFSLLALLLYKIIDWEFHFGLNGSFGNDLLYSISVIGGIEEMVKTIPFLIVLFFTNKITQPIDFIKYACLSALGFAFLENILYISHHQVTVISIRAIISTVSHMFYSSIIAYSLILAYFKPKMHPVLYFIAGYIIACIFHGLFDLFLFDSNFRSILLSTLVWIVSVNIFSVFINNAINNSALDKDYAKFDHDKIVSFLLCGLIIVAVLDYGLNASLQGTSEVNSQFFVSGIMLIFFIFFVSRRLGNIDIVKGEWERITFAR